MEAGVRFLRHIVFCCIYIFSIVYRQNNVALPWAAGLGGKWRYLTYWNMWIQCIFFGLCAVNDVWGTNCQPGINHPGQRSRLQQLRDFMFSSIALPVGSFVVTSFWGIYAYDRALVYPVILDKYIPSWLNHVMHTTVLLFLLIEMSMTNHYFPRRSKGLFGISMFAALYLTWIIVLALYGGVWVYPVLEVLSMYGRAAFISSCYIYFLILYIVCENINAIFWGKQSIYAKKL